MSEYGEFDRMSDDARHLAETADIDSLRVSLDETLDREPSDAQEVKARWYHVGMHALVLAHVAYAEYEGRSDE